MVFASQLPHKAVNLISDSEQQVDDFVGELTFENHLIDTLCQMRVRPRGRRQGSRCCPHRGGRPPLPPLLSGFGFRVSGFGFWVSGFGFRVSGFGFRVSRFGFRVSDIGFQVSGFGFRVSGIVFSV